MKGAVAVCLALLAVVLVQAEDSFPTSTSPKMLSQTGGMFDIDLQHLRPRGLILHEEMAPPVLPAGSRIINGRPAALQQFPYMAHIEAFNDSGSFLWQCAGSLVTRSVVLTSAWPCVSINATRWAVRLGSLNRAGDDPNAWTVESVTAIRSGDNYIAIIQLPKLAPVNEFIQAVSLPSSPDDNSYIGREAVVAGWGKTHPGSEGSDVLRWAKVLVIHNDFCNQLRPSAAATDRHLCAGSFSATVSEHERGAPLVLSTRGRDTQIGIFYTVTSWEINTPHPAFYTRVSSYIDWIKLYTESD